MTSSLTERMRREAKSLRDDWSDTGADLLDEAADRIESLEAENKKLREALEPFAELAKQLAYPEVEHIISRDGLRLKKDAEKPNYYLRTSDLVRARQAQSENPNV